MMKALGIDFGTTNSALAVADPSGASTLAAFQGEEGEQITTFRSILYFSAEERGADKKPLTVAGPDAIRKYLEADGKGRLIQSMKSHLASRTFTHTTILGRHYTLDDLIAIMVRKLREAAEKSLGDLGYKLYRSVERAKVELSNLEISLFFFKDAPVEIREKVRRLDFESWIQPEIGRIESCVDGLLERCNVSPGDVDSVFLTGGSALTPAVRRLFRRKFGADRLRGGEELTTVARGLALRAMEH